MKQKSLFLMCLLAFLPLVAYADAVEINGIYYNLNAANHTAEVTSNPIKYSDDVVIPETVMYSDVNYGVTSIGNQAFDGCRNMTSVTIPNSVTSIGNFAFCNCFGLTSVTIPNSVTSIGDKAFSCCFDLTSLTISNSVKSIGEKAFFSCNSLTSIVVEDGNTIYDSRDNSNALIETATNTLIVGCQNTIIPNSVTSIGECAFIWCNNLLKIEIPSTITSIGDGAFVSSPSATTVPTIISHITEPFAINGNVFGCSKNWPPETMDPSSATLYVPVGTKAKYEAFVGWTQFKEIVEIAQEHTDAQGVIYTLNDDGQTYTVSGYTDACTGAITIPTTVNGCSVTSIGFRAFQNCYSLTSVTIPNSVTTIGSNAFSGSGLTSIVVEDGNSKFDSRDNCNAIIETETNTLIAGCKNSVIPGNVTSIGNTAFYSCDGLTSVTIPSGVTSIGDEAFCSCDGLTSVTIPNSVSSIGNSAFNSCPNLKSVISHIQTPFIIDNNVFKYATFGNIVPSGATLFVPIGTKEAYEAFEGWTQFKKIAEGDPKEAKVGDLYFYYFSDTSNAMVIYGDYSNLTSVDIPATITIEGNVYNVTSIGNSVFSFCSGLTSVTIPNSITSIEKSAFVDCRNLNSVISLIETPFAIDNDVFMYNTSNGSEPSPATLYVPVGTKVRYEAFVGWTQFKEIVEIGQEYTDAQGVKYTLNDDGQTYAVSGHTDACTGAIKIPETVNGCSVTRISGNALTSATLTSITIPKSVTSMGSISFGYFFPPFGKNMSSIVVEEGNPVFDSRDNCNAIIETASNSLYLGCKNTIIPNTVTSIGEWAFSGCSSLTSITIPNSVTSIGGLAFNNCSGLTSITIPNSVTIIGGCAFWGCTGLTSITIPKSVINFSEAQLLNQYNMWICNPFDGNLNSIIVEEGNPKYDSRNNCNAIIETATNTLISGCKNTTIPSTVTTIDDDAFLRCSGLTSVTIPNSVTAIGSYAFGDISSLTDVCCYAENVPTTTVNAFRESNIENTTLYVPEASIEAYKAAAPWSEFKNIVAIELKDLIGQEYTDEQGVKYTFNAQGSYTVSGYTDACEGEIIIPETVNGYSVTSIGSGAFNHCSGLTSITIPQSVTLISIGINYDYPYSPFFDCKNLSTIVVEEGNPEYDSRDNCNAIIETTTNKLIIGCKNTIIPNSVTSVGDFAFIGCEGLVSITIPKSVTSFGFALHTCTGLTSIIVEEGNPVYDSRDNCNAIIETATNTLIAGCKKTTIPNNVKTIYYNAFVGCSGLTSVKIPNSVTLINSWSLGAITGLTDVYCYAEKAPTVEANGFAMSNIENATLHVPEGCIDAYKAATPWSDFKNIVAINTEVSISISGSGKTTLTSSEALDFSGFEDLKAYVATGFDASGTIWLTRIKQVPAGTPILIKGTPEKSYEVPVMDKCVAHFENMFQGSAVEDMSIDVTSADGKWNNYYMASGSFKKVTGPRTIGKGKCYLQLPASFKAAKAGADQTVKIADSGKSSYAPSVDIDLTNVEGLKAYAATGYDAANRTIWLTRIFKIQAGEGVLLKGEKGKTYTLPSADVQAYYGNMFVGNIGDKITIGETSDDGEWTNFYLASGQFKKVSGSREIGTNKSYLQLPTSMLLSSARGKKNAGINEWFMEELETETMLLGSIGGDDEDGSTRIDDIRNDNTQPETYYNLQGQRVDAPKKGIYIKNGKKVVIK